MISQDKHETTQINSFSIEVQTTESERARVTTRSIERGQTNENDENEAKQKETKEKLQPLPSACTVQLLKILTHRTLSGLLSLVTYAQKLINVVVLQ